MVKAFLLLILRAMDYAAMGIKIITASKDKTVMTTEFQ